MYGWKFYDVEIHDKKTDEFIKYENYTTLEEAKDYMKRMIDTKSLDYNEKMLLIERNYDTNRDLIKENVIEEVDYEN